MKVPGKEPGRTGKCCGLTIARWAMRVRVGQCMDFLLEGWDRPKQKVPSGRCTVQKGALGWRLACFSASPTTLSQGKTLPPGLVGHLVSLSTATNFTQKKGGPGTRLVIERRCLAFIKCVIKYFLRIHNQRTPELTGLNVVLCSGAPRGTRIFPKSCRARP